MTSPTADTAFVDPAPQPPQDDAASAPAEATPNEASASKPPGSREAAGTGGDSPAESGEAARTASASAKDEYPLQDNPLAGCSLCHVDIEDEFVGSLHFEEKVGCITCHGPSEAHLADENNEVKPDEVFARADVNRLCERCHECFRPKPKKPELTKDGQRKVCTDCHGPHDAALAADAGPSASR